MSSTLASPVGTESSNHRPVVVGEHLLAREARGFRSLPPEALQALRRARLGVAQ